MHSLGRPRATDRHSRRVVQVCAELFVGGWNAWTLRLWATDTDGIDLRALLSLPPACLVSLVPACAEV
jgi:hypothetical protein